MTLDELADWLVQREWRSTFTRRTLARGHDYALRGRVLKLAIAADGPLDARLTGSIKGSGGRTYRCTVDVGGAGQRLILETDCTCPMGVDCKHAVALLETLQMRSASRAQPPPETAPRLVIRAAADWHAIANQHEWDGWLARLGEASRPAPVAEPTHRFGILLRADQHVPARLLALPVWLRPSQSRSAAPGTLVDPQPLTLSERDGAVPTPAGGWPPAIAAALVTVLQAPTAWLGSKHWIEIHATHVEHAFEILLAAFPVWWERASQPLTRGADLAARPVWMEAADGSQQLALDAASDATNFLLGARPWYVRAADGVYGRVDIDPDLYAAVARAPTLQPTEVEGVRRRFAAAPGALPLPVQRERRVVGDVAPIPVLHLEAARAVRWDGTLLRFGVATCSFDYAGMRIPATQQGALVTRIDGERIVELHRQPAAERGYLERLQAHAVVPLQYIDVTRTLAGVDPDSALVALPDPRKPPLTPEDWQPLAAQLKAAGFRIEYSADFPRDEVVEVEGWYGEVAPAGSQWFDVSLGIEIAGERVDLMPILRQLIANRAFPLVRPQGEKPDATWRVRLDDRRSVLLPLARLRSLIDPLLEWLAGGTGEPRVHRSQLAELAGSALPWRGGETLQAELDRLRRAGQRDQVPPGFKATLRPYQREGLAWLNFLGDAGLGGILADDMGLGKTVQVLAHIACEKQQGRLTAPALILMPTSLIGNWVAEAARFTPDLKVLVLHGPQRKAAYAHFADCDLAFTTYPLLPRDRELLAAAQCSLLVLDEAQAIKNAASQAAHALRDIPATRRLAMTGTPLENHLGELWAEFDAVEPGLLGSQKQFNKVYRTPIEKGHDAARQDRLNRRIRPLLLRRRKQDVLTDLPPKTEVVRMLELEGGQRRLYETLRVAQHERVRKAMRARGLAQSSIIVLDALLKLRQVCCDPRLVKLPSAHSVHESAKLDALLELLDGLLTDGRSVLLFSQFTEMLALIDTALRERGIAFEMLTGDTPARERTRRIARFQAGKFPLFLVSLKAGGLGLNLTAADSVIHYDPWWNPAVEAQATDRAHRIGQTRPVFVYRLICTGTVEEKIQALQARKAELARAVLEGGGASARLQLDEADLAQLFAPL